MRYVANLSKLLAFCFLYMCLFVQVSVTLIYVDYITNYE
jgi:hypothetical protein